MKLSADGRTIENWRAPTTTAENGENFAGDDEGITRLNLQGLRARH